MDIGMTATIRPEIVKKTIDSFNENLMSISGNGDFRLIINVDPAGEEVDPWTVVDSVDAIFKKIQVRIAPVPNFAYAFKWVWGKVQSEFLLNIEDDWELLRPVSFQDMLRIMDEEKDLAILRLPFTDAEAFRAKQWNKWFPWNGRYFECPEELKGGLGFCGHPSLIRKEFIDQVQPLLLTDRCPEKQIKHHYPYMASILERWRFGVYQKPLEKRAIVDIGRNWRKEKGLIKDGSSSFIRWRT